MKHKKNTQTEKARAYVRVSTLKESQKYSPENQEGLIREVAAREGIKIEYVYIDRDTGTSIIAREDVQKMVNDAKNGSFNTIYFAALSRFSRDTLDALSLKRILVNALGIRVVSIEDNYDSGKEDNEMVFGIISSVNQKQSETISISSKRGIRQSAKKGNFTGSIPPYGYRKINVDGRKTLEIIPEQAKVVQLIFDLYVKRGMGEKSIVNILNDPDDERRVPSPKGGVWGITSIQRILQNETYTGYFTFCKHETQQVYEDLNDLQNRRKKLRMRDKSEWEKTDFQTHEAIISQELFDEAQRIRELRGGGKRGGQKRLVNVFAKMIFCKDCGSAMVAMSSKRTNKKLDNKRYVYLMCSKRRRQGEAGCANRLWIPYFDFRDRLINELIDRLEKVITREELGVGVADNSEFGTTQDIEKAIKRNEKVIADNRRLLFEIRRQHMLGDIPTDQYEFEKAQYEAEISESEKRLAELRKKADRRKDGERLRKDVRDSIGKLSSLSNYDELDETRVILSKLIERIEVDSEGEASVYSVLGQV